MQYGYFGDLAKEYVIPCLDTPQSWSNYLGSTEYGAIITNNAGGTCIGEVIIDSTRIDVVTILTSVIV